MNPPLEINQIDAMLCEDGLNIMFYGHTADPDRTFIASISRPVFSEMVLPSPLEEFRAGETLPPEWRAWARGSALIWHVAER